MDHLRGMPTNPRHWESQSLDHRIICIIRLNRGLFCGMLNIEWIPSLISEQKQHHRTEFCLGWSNQICVIDIQPRMRFWIRVDVNPQVWEEIKEMCTTTVVFIQIYIQILYSYLLSTCFVPLKFASFDRFDCSLTKATEWPNFIKRRFSTARSNMIQLKGADDTKSNQ